MGEKGTEGKEEGKRTLKEIERKRELEGKKKE